MKRLTNLGTIIRDLRPSDGNPRNSEGAFLTLSNGEIIFVYSRFKGNDPADHAFCDICLLRSRDTGESFGEDTIILTCEEEDSVNIMSLSLLEMQNGDIGLFYLVRTTYSLLRMFLRRSSDGGNTWSDRILCTPQQGFFVVNNDRVTRLSNNRIIIPTAIHRKGFSVSAEEKNGGFFDKRSDTMFFYSDDDGQTWQPSAGKCCMPYLSYCQSGLQEPGLLELTNGILWGWARTDIGRQYEMYSMDYGNTWTAPQPSFFSAPNSPLSMKRNIDGTIYAIWNPIPVYNGGIDHVDGIWTGGRTPMVIATSKDNGKTFTEPAILEDEYGHGYCYCAIHFIKESVLLAYCAGGKEDISILTKTRIRKIPLGELEKALS